MHICPEIKGQWLNLHFFLTFEGRNLRFSFDLSVTEFGLDVNVKLRYHCRRRLAQMVSSYHACINTHRLDPTYDYDNCFVYLRGT